MILQRSFSWLLAVALLMAGSATALAADYYVSPSGSDSNPGSQHAPFRSIGRGTQVARAGDVLNVLSGTYTEDPLTLPSGSTLRGAGGARPVIRPSGAVDHVLLFPAGSQGTTVENVVVDGLRTAQYTIATADTTSSNLTLQNSEITNAWGQCLLVQGTGWQILNNWIHDCGTNTTYDHGIYFSGDHSRIAGNTVERSACYNLQNYGSGNTSNNVYENNTFKDSGCGVTLSTGANHTFRNNTMTNEGVRQEGGMLIGAPNTTVEGNRLTNTRLLTINDAAGGSTVSNNTVCNAPVELSGVSEQGTSTACDGQTPAGATSQPAPRQPPSTTTSPTTHPATSPLVDAAAGHRGALPPAPQNLRLLPPRFAR